MSRASIASVLCLTIVGLVAAVLLWRATENMPAPGRVVSEGQAQIGGPFELIDQNGKAVSNAEFRGRYELIYFGYSYCPDVCPTTLAMMAQALSRLGSDRRLIAPIFITVDPGRDSPQVLKPYLAAFSSRFIGLTGDKREISAVEKEYHIYAHVRPLPHGSYAVDHSNVIYLMDKAGRFAAYYPGTISAQDLANDLRAMV